MRLPLLALAALSLLEIAGFVLVGSQIGVLATLALVLAASMAGAVLLRIQGLGALGRIRADMEAGRNPGRGLVDALMIEVAGILLIIPGFVTDILGLLLFIPAFREAGWNWLKGRLRIERLDGGMRPGRARRRSVVDLEPEEFSRAEPRSPWRLTDE